MVMEIEIALKKPGEKMQTFTPSAADSGDAPPVAQQLYAEVAVDGTNLGVGLTYGVPTVLHEEIKPGQLVWVPLKKGRAQGLVMSVDTVRPPFITRDVSEIVDPKPLLLPHQLKLAQWLAAYYYCGLYEAASLMLPAGFTRVARPTLTLAPAARNGLLPSNLGQNEYFLIELLREMRPTPHTTITADGEIIEEEPSEDERDQLLLNDAKKEYVARRAKTTFEKTVASLEQNGLVKRGFLLPRPGIKPKVKPFVRLAPWLRDLTEDSPELQKLVSRAYKQKLILELLRAELERGYLMPADELCLAAETNPDVIKAMVAKGLVEIEEHEVRRDPLSNRPQRQKAEEAPLLTYQQSIVWRSLLDGLMQPGAHTFLLHGVTGSGKTELYLRAIARVLREGKQAIVLVPEIALTAQTVDRFAARFPGKVAVRHSKLSPGEAYDEWRRAREGQADIVIGARSALFAPLERLGLIIIDEEHEWSYKQDESFGGALPLYHARTTARRLAELSGAKVILGSATPSVESYFHAESGEYTLLELPERVSPNTNGAGTVMSQDITVGQPPVAGLEKLYHTSQPLALPPVQIVDLRQELKAGNSSLFSRDLQQAIYRTLEAKQQTILFLNRRGTATVVMCRDCGHVVQCDACETPVVWHADLNYLLCHRCGKRYPNPKTCPVCTSSRIRHFGAGTKRIEEEVLKQFPQARVLRWDQDTISEGGRDSYQVLYDKMANHEADILVGTQMIAKGLDLPLVSLVGVITTDTGLFLPDFRAIERTFQILTQVAGRAGRRAELNGQARVIFQSYNPEQYAVQAASRHNYREFYNQELVFRQEYSYPPFSQLIKIVYSNPKEARAKLELERFVQDMRTEFEAAKLPPESWDFIGPAPAFQHKLRGLYRYQAILRLHNDLSETPDQHERQIRNIIGRQRSQLQHGWQIDVDPQSLL